MNRRCTILAILLAAAAAAGAGDYKAKKEAANAANVQKAANAAVPKDGYSVTNTIPIGGDALWDNFAVDPEGKFLYLPKQHKTVVIDIATGKPVAEILGGQGANAIALSPDAGRGFVTNRDGNVTLFDLKTNRVLGAIPVGDEPGAILYDPASKKILICCVGKIAVLSPTLDPANGKPDPAVPLQGKADSFVADGAGMVYMSMRDRDEIDVLDTRIMKIVTVWPLGPRGKPAGLSMDRLHSRLFMTCRNKLVVMSATDGHVLDEIPVGQQPFGTAFVDGKVFVTGFLDGIVTILAQNPDGKFEPFQSLLVKGALHSPIPNPKTGAVYIPTVDNENHRPKNGTFKILVLEKDKK